ncbi:MAG: ferrochelatase [Alphaproteobacteria bacterium]
MSEFEPTGRGRVGATRRVAVVLFNLGGPDSLDDVQPFLLNLFSDPAILRVPKVVRWFLARLITRRRSGKAKAIYEHLGGGSPLLKNTLAQAEALDEVMRRRGFEAVRCFVAMRYWHPMSLETAREVQKFEPDLVVLLPLYPQFSTTTTASSIEAWAAACRELGFDVPTHSLCCYPAAKGFVETIAAGVSAVLAKDGVPGRRVLFAAHGLPEKIIAAGDPYQWQVEKTAAAVIAALGMKDIDWVISYQSRVGRMIWIGPATDDEVVRAGADGVPLLVVPIAFVSEHSETLVELDVEYRDLAEECRVPNYQRLPTVSTAPGFVDALADLVVHAVDGPVGPCSDNGMRICPAALHGCPAVEMAPG